jgi:glycosyltransferase involved in cell wall biosynthesis
MKIAFFCEGFCESSSIAQPWRHVYEIAKRVNAMGNSVCIFTNELSGCSKISEKNGILIHRVKRNGLLLDTKDLLESFNNYDADLINWHSGPLSTIYFPHLQKNLKNKVVWTINQGKIFADDVRQMKISDILRLHKFWTSILYTIAPSFIIKRGANTHQVRQIITLSRRLKTYLERIGIDPKKISAISSGVDTKVLRPLSSSDALDQKISFGFKSDDRIILFFGPLSSPRGTDVLISAMPKILKKIPSAKLILLARKSFQDSTERKLVSAAGRQSAIRLLDGTMERGLLMRYLGIADLVALPFRFWPYTECPLTILEAMAMAKPVISTCTGSLPEIIKDGETGILVPPGDPNYFSQATVKLLSSGDLFDMGRRARKYVEENHDWDFITQLTFEVFEKVAR